MFLASHQALLSGNSARRLMCAGGAAEYSANSAQQIWILCHMTAPKQAENTAVTQRVTVLFILFRTKTHTQKEFWQSLNMSSGVCNLDVSCFYRYEYEQEFYISLLIWTDNFLVISSLKPAGPRVLYLIQLLCWAHLNDWQRQLINYLNHQLQSERHYTGFILSQKSR